ncbi:MAG: putative Ig domain-containing protein [Bacteroidota bacterium]
MNKPCRLAVAKAVLFAIFSLTFLLPSFSQVYEAENALLSGPVIDTGRMSSNNQFIDFINPTLDYVEWTVTATESGNYELTFGYQLGAPAGRPLELQVNGTVVENSFDFPSTGSWLTWSTIATQVPLNAGQNTIRLTAIGQSGANFDYLGVQSTGGNPPMANLQYKINFTDTINNSPDGWLSDIGEGYGLKTNGLTYGWVVPNTTTPVVLTQYARDRGPGFAPDILRRTLQHMNHPDVADVDGAWEIELPNGDYRIAVQVGDVNPENTENTQHIVRAEGTPLVDLIANVGDFGVLNAVRKVTVADGKLTLDGLTGFNTKIHYVIIESVGSLATPVVLQSTPRDGQLEVSLNASISANFLSLPNVSQNGATSLDNSTINQNTVQLFEVTSTADLPVSGTVNGTGGGDAVNFTPTATLKPNTTYRYYINGVKDLAGVDILPYSAVFRTGNDIDNNTGNLDDVSFVSAGAVANNAKYTSLVIGPDNKFYGLVINGDIHRWDIAANGTLTNQLTLSDWKSGYPNRTAIGLTFDPNSTADNLIAYVSHCSGGLSGAPEWDGKLSRITGNNLQNEEVLLTRLPRSVRDHLTNSIAFRPNKPDVLYFLQGSNSAGGAPDGAWGNRPERLLTAALLRLDLTKLPADLPLNVETSMNQSVINNADINSPTLSDDTYNPYYVDAPLTIYATGMRNAYDLIWHSNGQAYVPTNGTAGGSLSPASVAGTRRIDNTFYNGQTIPAIGPNEVQHDWLFRVNPANPLGYYGHPNPLRGEFVLNRGPLDEGDYPNTITPDANYRGAAYDFGFNKSPNGVIEYRSAGNLQGAILVCRYSGGSDIIALLPDGPNGDVATAKIGIPGFTGFNDPLDLIEDTRNGNLYVSDFATSQIILLRPDNNVPGRLTVNPERAIAETPVSTTQDFTVNVSNTGGAVVNNITFSINGDDADQFSLTGNTALGSLPISDSRTINLRFSPTSAGPKFAQLLVESSENSVVINLSGLATDGEPSLQWVLDAQFGQNKIDVGDDNPATNIINQTDFAAPLLGNEIVAPTFTTADITLPISMEVLGVYGPAQNGAVTTFGWYEAGNPNARQALFDINNSPNGNNRALNPNVVGNLNFNAGTPIFGFYSQWPVFNNRILYSEDGLNTFTGNIPHHVRVYPYPDEENAYILATEEHISGFDYQDIVVLVRNIRPVGNGGFLTLENRIVGNSDVQVDLPFNDILTFHRIQNVGVHQFHDTNVLRLENDGESDLLVNDFVISANNSFRISQILDANGNTKATNQPVSIPPDSYVDVSIEFFDNTNQKVLKFETLTINHNGTNSPTTVQLNGAIMQRPEGGSEISAKQIIDVFGFETNILSRININGEIQDDFTVQAGSRYPTDIDVNSGLYGDLIVSRFFQAADPNKEITATQLAAFHGCCAGEIRTELINHNVDFRHKGEWGQTLYPRLNSNTDVVAWNNVLAPTNAEAGPIVIAGYSTNSNNAQLGVRAFKARDPQGNIIPYTYLVLQDNVSTGGCGAGSANCDWNDQVILFQNIRPANEPSALGIPDQELVEEQNFEIDLSQYFDRGYAGNQFQYSATLSNGNPLPNWLTLDAATGGLNGATPTAPNTITVAVQVVDENGVTLTDEFVLTVTADNGNGGDLTTETCGGGTTIIYGNGTIEMRGQIGQQYFFQVLDESWNTVFNCGWECGRLKIATNLPDGLYRVYIRDANRTVICETIITLASGNTGGGGDPDIDGDGFPASQDCNDNDANLTVTGAACNDGDVNTENDVVQADCTCAGTFINNDPDNDGDGYPASQDCDDNDANLTVAGQVCDDGDAATNNDVMQANCTCAGTPIDNNDPDNDGDGFTASQDCDDNDANLTIVGATCDDGDASTVNDLVQSDCTCAGTLANGGGTVTETCDNGTSTVTYGNGTITMAGGSFYQVLDANWSEVFNCGWQCGNSQTVNGLAEGTYRVYIKGGDYAVICELVIDLNAGNGNNDPDADGDGYSASQDCDDNDANITVAGESCDDGDATTNNDTVQADCTCAGTPIDANDPDADGDGYPASQDCDDNDANLTVAGESCDDGDATTNNDTVQTDCTCAGTSTSGDGTITETCTNGTSTVTYGNGSITMTGGSFYQVLDANWSEVFNCGWQCGNSQTVSGLAAGAYRVYIKGGDYAVICELVIDLNAGNGGGNSGGNTDPDNDNDGVSASQDCNDNDANLTTVGATCDDGNGGTINDQVQADCTCAGTVPNTGGNGTEVTCDDLTITYGNGTVAMVGLANTNYYFKINDVNDNWTQVFGCSYECGSQQTATGLGNSTYLVTIYNADWTEHCATQIMMLDAPNATTASNRQRPQLDLTAFPKARTVALQWLTNSGYKATRFDVERSTDGVHFTTLQQQVNQEWGEDLAFHQTIDFAPTHGTNYYRIKETYLDGSAAYTAVQGVDFGIDLGAVSVFPNPAGGVLFVDLAAHTGKQGSLQLVNQFGQTVQAVDLAAIPDGLIRLDLGDVLSGVYYLRVSVVGQRDLVRKVLVLGE